MQEETAVETSIDPASDLVRKKNWQRRLFVVIASAILTFGACTFLGIPFGSAEQVILTLSSITMVTLLLLVRPSKLRFRISSLLVLTAVVAILIRSIQTGSAELLVLTVLPITMIAFLLRFLRSTGRFRFASLLLLAVFSAILFRMILQPSIRRLVQKAAIEEVTRNGGAVSTYDRKHQYVPDANGWVQTETGFMYPALFKHIENNFLSTLEVYELAIPSSLANKNILKALQTSDNCPIEVLLDGAGNSTGFRDAIKTRSDFPLERQMNPPWAGRRRLWPFVNVIDALNENDILFLNGLVSKGNVSELPVIKLGENCRFEPKLLESLENGFEIILSGNNTPFTKRVLGLEKLKRVSFEDNFIVNTALRTISERKLPLDSLSFYESNFDTESWQLLCDMTNCQSIRFSEMPYHLWRNPTQAFQKLGQNKSIKELTVYLNGGQNVRATSIDKAAVTSMIKIDGLKRLELHCDTDYDVEMIAAIEKSTLEDIWLDLKLNELEEIPKEPWMDRLKSLKIGRRQIVAPKSE